MADCAVTLYGLIDVSDVQANHADAKGDSVTTPRVAWFSGNRWGVTGRRPMGDSGLNVILRLEAEDESQTGSGDTPGVTCDRDAWVGVEIKAFRKLTLCRQNAIARDPIASATYGSTFYHFDKVTEIYLAADYLRLKDGDKVGSTNGFSSQTELGVGLRTRF
jgi:predicted porin